MLLTVSEECSQIHVEPTKRLHEEVPVHVRVVSCATMAESDEFGGKVGHSLAAYMTTAMEPGY